MNFNQGQQRICIYTTFEFFKLKTPLAGTLEQVVIYEIRSIHFVRVDVKMGTGLNRLIISTVIVEMNKNPTFTHQFILVWKNKQNSVLKLHTKETIT